MDNQGSPSDYLPGKGTCPMEYLVAMLLILVVLYLVLTVNKDRR